MSKSRTLEQLENEATLLLPDGVFVWLDDFRAWFRRLQERAASEDGAMPGTECYETELYPSCPRHCGSRYLKDFLATT